MTLLLVGALLVMASILISPLSSRIGMPVLLLFLIVGMLAGEDGPGGIQFNDVSTAFAVGNLALAVILLDGGMRTRVASFRVGLKPALVLASFGVVVTALVTGVFAAWVLNLPLLVGLLMGAIVSSTDAAAVFALLQSGGLRINERVEATLEIESGSNDPMAIFLTLMLIALIQQQGDNPLWSSVLMLLQQLGIGALAGLLGGLLMTALLMRVPLVQAMYPLLVITGGVALFSATNMLGGSGFLAIYLMGVFIASRKPPMLRGILQIHDGLAWLAQLILFLLLGLLVSPSDLLHTAVPALLIALVLMLVARPLATGLSLLPFGFSVHEHSFIAWVGLRGAVPIVLALFPLMAEVQAADTIFQVAFMVVLVSLILQGATLAQAARKLKLEIPGVQEPKARIELAQAATGNHELLLMPLNGERWSRPVAIRDLYLPAQMHLAAVFRAGNLLAAEADTELQQNDLVAVITPGDKAEEVGRLLSGVEPPGRLSNRRFFGDFTLQGEVTLADIDAVYGVRTDGFEPQLSLAECFARSRRGHPVVGDQLDLGDLMLVVQAVEGDRVTKVGLKLAVKGS